MEGVCKISRSNSKKRRGLLPGNNFPSFNLNQPGDEGVSGWPSPPKKVSGRVDMLTLPVAAARAAVAAGASG